MWRQDQIALHIASSCTIHEIAVANRQSCRVETLLGITGDLVKLIVEAFNQSLEDRLHQSEWLLAQLAKLILRFDELHMVAPADFSFHQLGADSLETPKLTLARLDIIRRSDGLLRGCGVDYLSKWQVSQFGARRERLFRISFR
jgi:hypothetical protein